MSDRRFHERTQLIVFEHTPSGIVARCLLFGDEQAPGGQH